MSTTIFRSFFSTMLMSLLIYGCTNNNDPKNQKVTGQKQASKNIFDRLAGTWASGDGKSFEQWKKENDSSYRSKGFVVDNGDTSWNEEGHVFKENNVWIFENTVKNQNDGRAIRFTAISMDELSVQFNNPQHDFPTDINYTLSDSNTVNAFIFGPGKDGRKDTIPFNFRRIR